MGASFVGPFYSLHSDNSVRFDPICIKQVFLSRLLFILMVPREKSDLKKISGKLFSALNEKSVDESFISFISSFAFSQSSLMPFNRIFVARRFEKKVLCSFHDVRKKN